MRMRGRGNSPRVHAHNRGVWEPDYCAGGFHFSAFHLYCAATKPNIVDLTVLKWKEEGQDHELRLIEMIASKWKYLAIDGFGKTYYEVKNIEDKNDTVNNCNKLFIAFLQNRSATWGGLVTALRRATLTDVADKLEAALPHTL